MKLYIDDIRTPKSQGWQIVRTSEQAIEWLERFGCPSYISFDHDLGGDDTAMIIVKCMVEKDLDMNGAFIPWDFEFNVHSANPIGKQNIEGLLGAYFDQREEQPLQFMKDLPSEWPTDEEVKDLLPKSYIPSEIPEYETHNSQSKSLSAQKTNSEDE